MAPDRIAVQHTVALSSPDNMVRIYMQPRAVSCEFRDADFFLCCQLIGCGFNRSPADSTQRYTKWYNSLSQAQLHTQVSLQSFGRPYILSQCVGQSCKYHQLL